MEITKSIAVADSNRRWTKLFAEYIAEKEGYEIAGIAENGKDAIDLIRRTHANVLVLNMILPCIDGIGVLESLAELQDKPKIICMAAVQNDFMIKKAFSLGAAYFASSPMDIPLLIRRIDELCSQESQQSGTSTSVRFESSKEHNASLDEEITSVFLAIGIPAHIKGYPYLREAVKMSINDTTIVNKITKELYPGVAAKFGTSPSKVERAIRHAIDIAWKRGRIQNMNELFGIDIYKANDRPTNGEFIALVADRLRMRNIA